MKTYSIEKFWENGFAGPFSLDVDPSTIDQATDFLKNMVKTRMGHPLYDRFSVRDWHLLKPSVLDLFLDEGVISSLNQILGEDLILWRTKVFNKNPFEGEIGWHQEWGAFNGEEIGNDVPALQYSGEKEHWDLTLWIALTDMTMDMGPLKFARGSHKKRFPISMAPIQKSGFFSDPFVDIASVKELINRALSNALIIDIDTSGAFSKEDIANPNLDMEQAKQKVIDYIKYAKGAVTLEFDENEHEIVSAEVKKGDYWIFSERTMHGSGINTSSKSRFAVNGRITLGDTLVYPGRLNGKYIDGSNIDITKHECVLLSGTNKEPRNVIAEINKISSSS